MPVADNCNHYVKLYFCLTPEHLSLGDEWCKEFVKLQLQEGFIRALEDLENEWPRIMKDYVHPPCRKNGVSGSSPYSGCPLIVELGLRARTRARMVYRLHKYG